MKSSILIAFLICTQFLSAEDYSNFLQNYEANNFEFQSLVLDFNGASNASKNIGLNGSGRTTGNFAGQYFQFENSFDRQGRTILNFNLNYNYQDFQGDINQSNRFDFSLNTDNRYYQGDNYYLLDFYGDYEFAADKDLVTHSIIFNPSIGMGYGRLEPLIYARKAIDLVKFLDRDTLLSKEITEKELTQLSDDLATIGNFRFFDTRLGRIKQLKALDNKLANLGIINRRDVEYFTTINDIFYFANSFERFSGSRHEVGINPFLNTEILNNGIQFEGFRSYEFNIFYSYQYHIPINYSHQFSLAVFNSFEVADNDYVLFQKGFEIDNRTSLAVSHNWYPTTRTRLSNNFSFSSRIIDNGNNYELNGGIAGNSGFYYYYSPRLRFSGNAGYGFTQLIDLTNTSTSDDRFNISLSFGVDYAIF